MSSLIRPEAKATIPLLDLGQSFQSISLELLQRERDDYDPAPAATVQRYEEILAALADLIWEQPVTCLDDLTATMIPVVFYDLRGQRDLQIPARQPPSLLALAPIGRLLLAAYQTDLMDVTEEGKELAAEQVLLWPNWISSQPAGPSV